MQILKYKGLFINLIKQRRMSKILIKNINGALLNFTSKYYFEYLFCN